VLDEVVVDPGDLCRSCSGMDATPSTATVSNDVQIVDDPRAA
jgi:hypothetical protein